MTQHPNNSTHTQFTVEQQILHRLLLHSSTNQATGLYHGKTGLILCLMHYAEQTQKWYYETIAGELIKELTGEIHSGLPGGFASGLSGIGWGIEYLIQNGFMNGNSLDICETIDKKIMEPDLRRMTDLSLDTGLEGILHYVLAHIKGVLAQHGTLPFDETYLSDLYQAVTAIAANEKASEGLKQLAVQYACFYENRTTPDYSMSLSLVVEEMEEVTEEKLGFYPLGLKKGLAGYLLKQCLEERK